jgi:hypothetical protein
MSGDIHALTDTTNGTKVSEIRHKFLSEVESNPDLYHDIDVERVRTEDWQVERYVIRHETVDKAYEALVAAMQWKKSFGVHDRTDTYFPRELVYVIGYEPQSRDREGRVVRWSVLRHYKKISDFSPLILQFTAHLVESLDREAGNMGYVSVVDIKGTGYANCDMTLTLAMIDFMRHYPLGPRLSVCMDLPWILKGVAKVIISLLPKSYRNKVKIINGNQLDEYLDAEEIPVTFGGKRVTTTSCVDHMPSLRECRHLGFSKKQMDKFYDTYRDLFSKVDVN